jgi:hypothetical protein
MELLIVFMASERMDSEIGRRFFGLTAAQAPILPG